MAANNISQCTVRIKTITANINITSNRLSYCPATAQLSSSICKTNICSLNQVYRWLCCVPDNISNTIHLIKNLCKESAVRKLTFLPLGNIKEIHLPCKVLKPRGMASSLLCMQMPLSCYTVYWKLTAGLPKRWLIIRTWRHTEMTLRFW